MVTSMAAMAGTLFIVGFDMIKWSDVKHYAPERPELLIYLSTFVSIVFFGPATGIAVAAALSVSVFLLRISQLELGIERAENHRVLKVKGALFYASVASLMEMIRTLREEDLVVDLQFATHIDQSAVDFFIHEASSMKAIGTTLSLRVNDKQRNFLLSLGLNDIELLVAKEN